MYWENVSTEFKPSNPKAYWGLEKLVNAQKHRALLDDTPTRLSKRLDKIFCLSNSARKQDKNDDKFLLANGGKCGVNEILRTNKKRKKAIGVLRNGVN